MNPLPNLPQHAVGMIGQIAAALPQVLITIYLARRIGLEIAGLFAVATGLAAAAFTAALWGFSPHIVLHRLHRFPAMTYLVARVLALLLVSIGILAASRAYFPDIGLLLVLAVIAFRVSDAIIDLHFGLAQVWLGAGRAINFFAGLHGGKLALLAVMLAVAEIVPDLTPESVILGGSVLSVIGAAVFLLMQPRLRHGADNSPGQIARLFGETSWFGLAAVLCAIVTNLPRIKLPLMLDGDALGAAGISLTISTFFGMAFYTAWIRHFSALAIGASDRAVAAFVVEIAVLASVFVAAAIWLLPPLASWIFEFELSQFGDPVRDILLAAVVFFAGMSMCNLYKLGRYPWLEGLAYLLAIILILVMRDVAPGWTGVPELLLTAGAAMGILSLPAWFVRRTGRHGDESHA